MSGEGFLKYCINSRNQKKFMDFTCKNKIFLYGKYTIKYMKDKRFITLIYKKLIKSIRQNGEHSKIKKMSGHLHKLLMEV